MDASGSNAFAGLAEESESVREMTRLVFVLACDLVHEVYETVPFMLLDSLEVIDSDRIAALIECLTDYTDHLLVALLPRTSPRSPRSTGVSRASDCAPR